MSETSKPTNTILIAFLLPDDKGDWTEIEADDVADQFRDIINEEWERNAASRPGYHTPCQISAIPAPQWVTAKSLANLRAMTADGAKLANFLAEHSEGARDETESTVDIAIRLLSERVFSGSPESMSGEPRCRNCGMLIDYQRESFGDVWVHMFTRQMSCYQGGPIAAPKPDSEPSGSSQEADQA